MIPYNELVKTPQYWIEDIEAKIYNCVIEQMDQDGMVLEDFARLYDIKEEMLKSIIDGQMEGFSIQEIIEIVVKLGRYPVLRLCRD